MKLTYFVGPYDLLNHKTLQPTPMTIEGLLRLCYDNTPDTSAVFPIHQSILLCTSVLSACSLCFMVLVFRLHIFSNKNFDVCRDAFTNLQTVIYFLL